MPVGRWASGLEERRNIDMEKNAIFYACEEKLCHQQLPFLKQIHGARHQAEYSSDIISCNEIGRVINNIV